MSSLIDATLPPPDVAVDKARDFVAPLGVIKAELNHGGFIAPGRALAAEHAALVALADEVAATLDRIDTKAAQLDALLDSIVPGGGGEEPNPGGGGIPPPGAAGAVTTRRGVDVTIDLKALAPHGAVFRIARGPANGHLGRDEMHTVRWIRGEQAERFDGVFEPGGTAVRYRPRFAHVGSDVFTYQVVGPAGELSPAATVTVTMADPAPTATFTDPALFKARVAAMLPGDRIRFRRALSSPVDLGLVNVNGAGSVDDPAVVEIDAALTGTTRFFLNAADQHLRGGEWRDGTGLDATESQGRLVVLGGDRTKFGDCLMSGYRGGANWQNAVYVRYGRRDAEVADVQFRNCRRSTVCFGPGGGATDFPVRPRLLYCDWEGALSETNCHFQCGTQSGVQQIVQPQSRHALYAYFEGLAFVGTRDANGGGVETGSLKCTHAYLYNILEKDNHGDQGFLFRVGGEQHMRNLIAYDCSGVFDISTENSSLVNVYWKRADDERSSRIYDEWFWDVAGVNGANFGQAANNFTLAHFTYLNGAASQPAIVTGHDQGDRYGRHATGVAIEGGIVDAAEIMMHIEGTGTTRAYYQNDTFLARNAVRRIVRPRAGSTYFPPNSKAGDPLFVDRTLNFRTARGRVIPLVLRVPGKGGAADAYALESRAYFPEDIFGLPRPRGDCTAGCAEAVAGAGGGGGGTPGTPATRESPADWPAVQADSRYHHTLTPAAPFVVTAETTSAGDSDYLGLITLAETLDVTVPLVGGNVSTHLYVYQADAAGARASSTPLHTTEGRTPKTIAARLPAGRYYLGAFTASGAATTFDARIDATRPPAEDPLVPNPAFQAQKDAKTTFDLLAGAVSPDGSALSVTALGATTRATSALALLADRRRAEYTTSAGSLAADGFDFTVTTARARSKVARATVTVLEAPANATGFVYGFNSARDILCDNFAQVRAAMGDPTRANMHKVLRDGTGVLTDMGLWYVDAPGHTVRTESKHGRRLGNGQRLYVRQNGDRTRFYGFGYIDGARNTGGTGSHVMLDGCQDVVIGDLTGKGLRADAVHNHAFSAVNSALNCTFRGLVLFNINDTTAAGQMGAYPAGIVFEDCWFVDCGPLAKNTNCLVLQFNQGGENRNYPNRSENPAWRNSRSTARRCHFIRAHGFFSQFKVGGGIYEECLFHGGSLNDTAQWNTQDQVNFRDGEGGLFIRCVSYGTYEGFLMQGQRGIMRDSVVINPAYAGMRMWRGGRVTDDYPPNNGWNETLPSLANKVYNCTFDLGPHYRSGDVPMAATFDSSGSAWNQGDCRLNEFRNNVWLMNSTSAGGIGNFGSNTYADNLFWSKGGRFNGSVPGHVKGLQHADPRIVRINRTYTVPVSGERFVVPIPHVGAGGAAIGRADPAFVRTKDVWGVDQGGTDLFGNPWGSAPNLGAIATVA